MAQILKPKVFRKMPVITKSVGTSHKEKPFSQKPFKIRLKLGILVRHVPAFLVILKSKSETVGWKSW